MSQASKAPIAIEAVARIDALFAIQCDIEGKPPQERSRVRQLRRRPLTFLISQRVGAQLKLDHERT